MKRALFFACACALAATAAAQQFKWIDKDGHVQYGDTPPPGVKVTRLRAPSGPAPAAPDAKGASKGPLTPAEQEAAFRKRQADAQKAADKEAKAAQDDQAKRDNCASARQQLSELESGARIARTNAQGERYFLEDEQRAGEIAKARKLVSDWCN